MSETITPLLKSIRSAPLDGAGCLFLDRDGVINERVVDGYVLEWSDFAFRPGVIGALKIAARYFPLVVVSNQRCVARSLISSDRMRNIMDAMAAELSANGVELAGWYVCPHDHIDRCSCRKPLPGMLNAAARDLKVDLRASFMIGDSPTDVEAGVAAGCSRSILVDPAKETELMRVVQTIIGDFVNAG